MESNTPAVTGAKVWGFHVGRSVAKHRAKSERAARTKASPFYSLRDLEEAEKNPNSARSRRVIAAWKAAYEELLNDEGLKKAIGSALDNTNYQNLKRWCEANEKSYPRAVREIGELSVSTVRVLPISQVKRKPGRPSGSTPSTKARISELAAWGKSKRQFAKEKNLSYSAVREFYRRHKSAIEKMRDPSQK